MSEYSIIKCNYDDHAYSILNIYNDIILTSTAIFDYKARPLESMAKWFQTKQLNNFPVIGIENEDGQLMAVGTFGTFRDWPAYKYTVEHSVAVHKDFRGIGLGKKIVLELIQEAKDREMHAIIGGIEVTNTASIKLHLNLGFELVGTLPQVGYKFGNWLDLALYQLILKTPSNPLDG